MNQQEMISVGIALGACYLAYKFGKSPVVHAAAIAVGAVIVAKRLPYVGSAL